MTNAMFSTVPAGWDPAFIFARAGVTNHFGYGPVDDGLKLGYCLDDGEAVLAAIAAYPVAYADAVARPAALQRIGEIRSERIRSFAWGGFTLTLDDMTEGRIGRAVQWLDRRPDRDSVLWDLGGRNFVTIPRADLIALGVAVGDYIQACFDHSAELAQQVRAAADLDALAAIDVEAGWPQPGGTDAQA